MSALARIKKTAAQHEQERQYDKALALYARLLDGAEAGEEEVDVALFNRAGDLALRVGDAGRAVGYFERALDLYAAAGLLNNAVALGVKILRHAPHHLSAHYTLGVLYARKGFVGDARHHLLTYAVQMQRAGRADEVGRVLREVAATCGDAAELRSAYDAYGALGGDPAQAAALAAGAPPVDAPAPRRSPVAAGAEPTFLDLSETGAAPAGAHGLLVDDVDAADASEPPAVAPLVLAAAIDGAGFEPAVAVPAAAPAFVTPTWDLPAVAELAAADAPAGGPAVQVAELDLLLPTGLAFDETPEAGFADALTVDLSDPDTGRGLEVGPVRTASADSADPLVFLELTGDDAIEIDHPGPVTRAIADVPRPVADLGRPVALANEPPPLRLADLADVRERRVAARPVGDAPTIDAADPAFAVAFEPPFARSVEPAPARLADVLAPDLVGEHEPAADRRVPPATPADRPADAASWHAADAAEDGLDLGAWLRETTPEESPRMTTAAVPQSGDEQADFDATLRTFTAGVTRVVGHDDFDSHYDLGVAFREMGLVEEAIVQFQRAAQAPGRPLRALEALGQCFLDAGQPELTLSALAEPVAAADARGGDASLLAVHYLMGAAAQALGRPDDARRWLVRVVATDVRFRDASHRLAALSPPTPTR